MPTPAELRAACYSILEVAKAQPDKAMRRILAARAFALAQEAQLEAWREAGRWPRASAAE